MSKKEKSKKTKSKKAKKGQKVNIHYVGTFDDGTEFDNSRNREEAMSLEVGTGQLIPGFEAALPGMKVGEVKNIKLEPVDAYGDVNPEAFETVPHSSFPKDFEFEVGAMVRGQNAMGREIIAKIDSVKDDAIVLNFNHPLAGKTLNFEIELLSVE